MIGPGLLGIVVIAALGGMLTRRRLRNIERVFPVMDEPVEPELASHLADPVLRLSAWLRTGLAVGIVFIMSTKPNAAGALSALGIAVVLGLAAGLPAFMGQPRVHRA